MSLFGVASTWPSARASAKNALISSYCSTERSPSPFSSAESSPAWTPDGAGAPGMEVGAATGRYRSCCGGDLQQLGWGGDRGRGGGKFPSRQVHPTETSPGVKPITGSTFPGGKGSAHSITLSQLPLPSPWEHFHTGKSWEKRHEEC